MERTAIEGSLFLTALAIAMLWGTTVSGASKQQIVMMWQVHHNTSSQELIYLKSQGVTMTQSFAAPRWTDQQLDIHLASLRQHGLSAAVYLGTHRNTASGCKFPQDTLDRISRFRNVESIAMWHMLDEPASQNISKKCQIELYQNIKMVDQNRPIMISANNNRRSKFRDFFTEEAFDVLDLHYYVNPHIARGQRNMMNLFKEYRTRDYPVIVTFRAFESPHKPGRRSMVFKSFFEQYRFFIQDSDVTMNFGFYGWALAPNRGIRDVRSIREQFEEFMAWWRASSSLAQPLGIGSRSTTTRDRIRRLP